MARHAEDGLGRAADGVDVVDRCLRVDALSSREHGELSYQGAPRRRGKLSGEVGEQRHPDVGPLNPPTCAALTMSSPVGSCAGKAFSPKYRPRTPTRARP